jgi:2'-5' RNA ligase
MKQAIVIFLRKDAKVESVRKKYVPHYNKFKPPVSLVYEFNNVNQNKLYGHIKKSISDIKAFNIALDGLKKSAKDYYLYLAVGKNKDKLILLHKRLNLGLLRNFKNKDMPKYIPHITLGIFNSKKEIETAIKEIKKENLQVKYFVDSIQLITLNGDDALKTVKTFALS